MWLSPAQGAVALWSPFPSCPCGRCVIKSQFNGFNSHLQLWKELTGYINYQCIVKKFVLSRAESHCLQLWKEVSRAGVLMPIHFVIFRLTKKVPIVKIGTGFDLALEPSFAKSKREECDGPEEVEG